MNGDNCLTFNDTLGKLGMDQKSIGMRFVSEKDKEQDKPDVYLALEQAADFGATAVYFRFYDNAKPPQPQVYIYDRTELKDYPESDADIHHMLWNAGIVPFCFIFKSSKVLVYNCSKKPSYDELGVFTTDEHGLINLLDEAQKELEIYNAKKFDSGLFWESEAGKKFDFNQGAYQQLLDQLKNVKSIIISRVGNEHASLVKRLLMMLILIKYLEERKGDDGNGALIPNEFYKKFKPDNPSLEGVLDNPDTFIAVLQELTKKESFNGHLFYLNEAEQIALKNKIDPNLLKYFVRGDMEFFAGNKQSSVGQISLWRLYEFNYLPIELISHIYEDFLVDEKGQKKEGVVYTPPYLVQFLIDHAMPLATPQKHFKVLDPACGSGIFLVGAYKRMIQWWRYENDWKRPGKEDIEDLKQILKNSILGCDIEAEAVTLSYFSLSLALLDSLSPKEIWGNVHFDNLIGTNLIQGDFFKTIYEGKLKEKFQLIIGNPPFKSSFTKWAEKIDNEEKNSNVNRHDVPDKQVSLLFLEQSLKLLAGAGKCCLILPSGPTLYNSGSLDFRKYLFEQYWVKSIFDFTPLRTKLFVGSSSNAKPAVVAITAENSEPRGRSCFHYIFRRTKVSGEKIDFEIDHYDIHEIAYDTALNNARVWQSNFMGGGRLHYLLNKILILRTLGEYLEEKVTNNGWMVGEGWISSGNEEVKRVRELSLRNYRTDVEESEFSRLEKKYKADWITGHNYVVTGSFTEKKIEEIKESDIQYYYRSAKDNKEIFKPPHLLIKEQTGVNSIPIEYREDYLTFKNEIIGIHAPEKDQKQLKKIESRFKGSKLYSALLWLLSGRSITAREGVVLKQDILSLPYPEEEIDFDPIEEILLSDISIYYSEFRKTGEKSIVLSRPNKKDLEAFGELYCRILNSVFGGFKPLKPVVGNDFIAFPFVLGDSTEMDIPRDISDIEVKLNSLIDSQQGFNLWVKRIVKIYHKNVIFLYKPNQKRYWLRSIAIRDADETFLDLYKQGK